ncbi:MAG: UDP-N-acetylmuramate--L-alanine ligase [Chloroflexi bacterium]|nr:UDP-N-acetylmuramate--L-alanine ligase [Chloroflexota bacterium]
MKKIHFIGIGGTGLSAIAIVLIESGYLVSGSDMQESALTQKLRDRGAKVFIGHSAANLADADTVILSSAISADNPEVIAAKVKNIPLLKRADFLGALMEGRDGIAVAGTHGKTTTTAMIAFMLTQAKLDPTFIVGGTLTNLGTNAKHGNGSPFVIEADEYDGMFWGLKPKIAVITNVEHDHPDCYPTMESYRAAFEKFVSLVPNSGALIVCRDHDGAKEIGEWASQKNIRVIWYGLKNGAEWKAENIQANSAGGSDYVVTRGGQSVGLVRTRVPGNHNVVNSLAAIAATGLLGVDFNIARNALAEFTGVGRRFEVKGEVGGITVIDDYAHHPTEIKATLAAARKRFGDRNLWALFQPHTFSRTKILLSEFASSFSDADHVLVTDIFRSRESFDASVSSKDIVAQMKHADARYVPTLAEAGTVLLAELRNGDVLITLGAGDGNTVGEKVLSSYDEQNAISIHDTRNAHAGNQPSLAGR